MVGCSYRLTAGLSRTSQALRRMKNLAHAGQKRVVLSFANIVNLKEQMKKRARRFAAIRAGSELPSRYQSAMTSVVSVPAIFTNSRRSSCL